MDLGSWIKIGLTVIGAFSTIATITPNRHDNAVADTILNVINLFGMNVGKAKNEVK